MAGRSTCDKCSIRHSALCGALKGAELARLNAIAFHRRLDAGRFILGPAQEQEYCANIISGVVKLSKTLEDGRQQIVGLQFASDFVGRLFGGKAAYIAEAATEVELCCYGRSQFEALLSELPQMRQSLLLRTLDELDAAREWMVLLGRKTAAERVASFILMIADRQQRAGCAETLPTGAIELELPLSRTETGEYLGLTIETVSRQLKRLRTAGVIRMRGIRVLTIVDMAALRRIAEHEQS
jgi:CRP/FNR family transcriptional regulator